MFDKLRSMFGSRKRVAVPAHPVAGEWYRIHERRPHPSQSGASRFAIVSEFLPPYNIEGRGLPNLGEPRLFPVNAQDFEPGRVVLVGLPEQTGQFTTGPLFTPGEQR